MTTNVGKLSGKSMLVTGGGTGIGRACAVRLAADGAAVTICGRTESSLKTAVEMITQSAGFGGSASYKVGDVTDEGSVKDIIHAAAEATGSLDGLIANAGGGDGIPTPYAEIDAEDFLQTMELNVMGTLYCVKHSLPLMINAGGGSFVAMSSLAGHVTHRYGKGYCVAKAGVEAMMRNAADEYGARNIRFNAIRPGLIATEMIAVGMPEGSRIYKDYMENTPMAAAGQPEDVAELARFLIGPESRWITGQCINVDGGNSLRRGGDFSLILPGEEDMG